MKGYLLLFDIRGKLIVNSYQINDDNSPIHCLNFHRSLASKNTYSLEIFCNVEKLKNLVKNDNDPKFMSYFRNYLSFKDF